MTEADGGPQVDQQTHIEVSDLVRTFDASQPWLVRQIARQGRRVVRAVDGVSFTIAHGTTLGLVGESGCGKSTVARCLAGLLAPDAGRIAIAGSRSVDGRPVDGRPVDGRPGDGRPGDDRPGDDRPRAGRPARGEIQMVFQDPYSSLNPRWRVREAVGDSLLAFGLARNRREMRAQVDALLVDVGLAPEDADRYPHEFSGGQRQRIAVARAIASKPSILIADEPTSALDVSVQAQILNLLRDLQASRHLTCLFISHDLGVVDHMADTVGVMYLGRLVELRDKSALFERPLHPYSRMLIETAPRLKRSDHPRAAIAGEVPSPLAPPPGCAFHPRCPLANDRCRRERPEPMKVPDGGAVACHAVEERRAVGAG